MKKDDVKVGTRVYKNNVMLSTDRKTDSYYGTILSEPFKEENNYKGTWRVTVKFDNGKEVATPLSRIQPVKEED